MVLTSWPGSSARSALGTHSSSSTRIGDEVRLCLLERSDRDLAAHGREVVEKLLKRVSAFEVVDQGLQRYPRADEDRRPPRMSGSE